MTEQKGKGAIIHKHGGKSTYNPCVKMTLLDNKNLGVFDIPYGEYIIRVYVSQDGKRNLFDENVKVLTLDAGAYVDVTDQFVTKFNKNSNLRPSGDNVFKIAGRIYNKVNA